jgi:hypothetical protein
LLVELIEVKVFSCAHFRRATGERDSKDRSRLSYDGKNVRWLLVVSFEMVSSQSPPLVLCPDSSVSGGYTLPSKSQQEGRRRRKIKRGFRMEINNTKESKEKEEAFGNAKSLRCRWRSEPSVGR